MKVTGPALLASLLLFFVSATMADKATIVSDTELYQRPSVQSHVIQTLKAGTHVNTQSRQGSWKKILVGNAQTGWVRSYRVRSGTLKVSTEEQKSGGFFGGLASLSRKASGLFSSRKKEYSFQNTATIGVRGLSEEQIKNARPDFNELGRMEAFRSSRSIAINYAKRAKLSAVKINHMPETEAEK
jgi:hypothetical protein